MKLEFAHKEIKEFMDGNLHYKNDGSEINVSSATADDLLERKHWLDGKWVNVFQLTSDSPKRKSDAKEIAATYPEGFPFADVLTKASIRHEGAILLDKEQLLRVNGIGEAKADAILEFVKEK
jgi:hypothetical protein